MNRVTVKDVDGNGHHRAKVLLVIVLSDGGKGHFCKVRLKINADLGLLFV